MYLCPYCGCDLKTMPQRKRNCPSCQKPIYIKSTPKNRTKRIMTEVQAIAAEEDWNLYNIRQRSISVLFPFGLTELDIESERGRGAKTDSQAVLSLLTYIEKQTDNLNKRKMALRLLAIYAEEDGRPFHEYLLEANRCELLQHKQMRVKKVEILILRLGDTCKECESNMKRIFDIDVALQLMPLPHPKCTYTIAGKRPGFCRCSYIPVFD